ncbi:hypothetical protein HZ326_2810 [Fusarium oxysporum f. sp. albedinis]|nr:hypothetical protein HZ326_2810 [Fusarium oxysporum f. sp. albedinis]
MSPFPFQYHPSSTFRIVNSQTGSTTWSYKSKYLVDLHAQLASLNVDSEYRYHEMHQCSKKRPFHRPSFLCIPTEFHLLVLIPQTEDNRSGVDAGILTGYQRVLLSGSSPQSTCLIVLSRDHISCL